MMDKTPTRFSSTSVLAAALLLAACREEAPVPANPTWVDDVEPILRANCFHCHGGGDRPMGTQRWDFFYEAMDPPPGSPLGTVGEPLEPRVAELNIPPALRPIATRTALANWKIFTLPTMGDDIRMPPPPALRLSDRDLAVLKAFTGVRGMRAGNQAPTAVWRKQGMVFEVRDGDREQVLGKLVCGAMEWPILRTGAHNLPAGATLPCTAWLFDGQDTARVTLQ